MHLKKFTEDVTVQFIVKVHSSEGNPNYKRKIPTKYKARNVKFHLKESPQNNLISCC